MDTKIVQDRIKVKYDLEFSLEHNRSDQPYKVKRIYVEGEIYDGPRYGREPEPHWKPEEFDNLSIPEQDALEDEYVKRLRDFELQNKEWCGTAIKASMTLLDGAYRDKSKVEKDSPLYPYIDLFNDDMTLLLGDEFIPIGKVCPRLLVIDWIESLSRFKSERLMDLLLQDVSRTLNLGLDAIVINTQASKPDDPKLRVDFKYWDRMVQMEKRDSGLRKYLLEIGFMETQVGDLLMKYIEDPD